MPYNDRPDDDALRAVAEADQAEAETEATARETINWTMHVNSTEAQTFHNNALAAAHLARGKALDAVAEVLPPLATASVLFALGYAVRGFRRAP